MTPERLLPLVGRGVVALVALLLLGGARPTWAGCSVSVSAGMNFGAYNVFSPTALDTTGYVSYRCDMGHNYSTMRISLTRGRSTTYAARLLGFGGDLLQYNLFLDPSRSVVWGDGSEGTGVFSDAGLTLARDNLPVYGRVHPGQDARPGAYADTITVLIDF